jgi:hypothetical protein
MFHLVRVVRYRSLTSMPIEQPNLYAVEGPSRFDTSKGEFVVDQSHIICGPLLKLPKVCLQTTETEDPVEFGSIIFARPVWLWRLQVVVGCIAMVLIAFAYFLLFRFDAISMSLWPGKLLVFGPVCLTAVIVLPWHFMKSPVRVHGYLSKRRRPAWFMAGLLVFVTSLPFLIVLVGFISRSAPWSISAMFSSESWWPVVMLIGAIATGNMLRRLLEWHWRTTRTRSLVFKAKPIDNGLFAVSGFTPEFLNQMLSQPKG